MTDEEVIGRVLAGETALYEVIMRRYNQRLYRSAYSILRDEAEAEDVIQDAYVRAYEHLAQFSGEAKFSTWLTRIAIHEALARKEKRKRLEPEIEERSGTMPDPESIALQNEAKSLLESAVSALPDNYRSVFMLREIEGLSTAETAECLDIGEDAVKVRLHRSRRMIREDLVQRAGAFAFMGDRCDRVVAGVLARIISQSSRSAWTPATRE